MHQQIPDTTWFSRAGWLLKMAYRESRGSRKKLVYFLLSIVMGVAALVAILSFSHNLEDAIDQQARQLLGSDLVFSSQIPFSEQMEILLDSLVGPQSREVEFNSMAQFPAAGSTRLSRVRAVESGWPYYGTIKTDPPEAANAYHNGYQTIVERTLSVQYGLGIGDTVRLGLVDFTIAGFILDVPGESAAASAIGPRIFIPHPKVSETGLLQRGSRVEYKAHLKITSEKPISDILEPLKVTLAEQRVSAETVSQRKAAFGLAFSNMNQFLNLVGFMALLLGGIGVASSVFTYIKQRITTVAVLHCLGAQTGQTTAIYVIQMLMIGFLGALAGIFLGILIQFFLPVLLSDFIPVDIVLFISWPAVFTGLLVGTATALLFALLPLSAVRDVSPLHTLRSETGQIAKRFDPVRISIYLLLVLSVTGYLVSQTNHWYEGVLFAVGIFTALGILTGIAKAIVILLRKYFPSGWSYVWRQGLANLYRPNNQTLTLLLTVGFSTFLIATLYFTQGIILKQLDVTRQENDANLVFFDIQSDQKETLKSMLNELDAPVLMDVPVVTMRMTHINEIRVEELRLSGERTIPDWLYGREIRATYRDSLTNGEQILDGDWVPEVSFSDDSIPISIEQSVAVTMDLKIGDRFRFNVQGIPIETQVASIREVFWQQVQPNFIFLFPNGVLDEAPQFHIISTRANNPDHSAILQSRLVADFPNISAIDLELIIETVDDILGKITYVIQFMALFSVITGLIVLTGALSTSRFQRAKENVLLKTIGASKKQLLTIQFAEYLFLGSLSALTGLILAWISAFILANVLFDAGFAFALWPSVVIFVLVAGLSTFFGFLNSRGLYNQPAIDVLTD